MRVEEVRAQFPAVARSSYLNAAAASPLSLAVHQAVVDHSREALEWGDVGFSGWLLRKEETRAKVAKLLGATKEELAFVPSTSMAFHFIGRMLQQRGVREVLTLETEFPSTTLPLLNLGLRLRVVRPRKDGTYAVEDVADALTAKTGAIALSAVQYASGFRIDLGAISKLCRDRKLLFAVNAVQAVGQVPIDVKALKADFTTAIAHKWMMGGYGVGMLYVRRALLREGTLPVAGWLSTRKPLKMDPLAGTRRLGAVGEGAYTAERAQFRTDASALEPGSSAWGPLFGLGAAVDLLTEVGVDKIQAHNLALQATLRKRLRQQGFVPNLPDDPAIGSGICVFKVDGLPNAVAHELAKRGVVVSPRGGGLRVATHVFNSQEDLDQLFWAMEKVGVKPASVPKAKRRR